jgi:hypothetical protein
MAPLSASSPLEPLHFIVPGHFGQLLDLGNAVDADEFGDDEFSHDVLLFWPEDGWRRLDATRNEGKILPA